MSKNYAAILMYHAVDDRPEYAWSIAPEVFAWQMACLAQSGREVVSLAELVRRKAAHEPLNGAIAITFDDGYRDNLTDALPILERYQFPATVFISSGRIGGANKWGIERLAPDELKTLASSPLITIGSHAATHRMLTKLTPEELRAEAVGSKAALETLLGSPVSLFAYPFGNLNDAVAKSVQDAGFDCAVTTRPGDVHSDSDPFMLPRFSVDFGTNKMRFKAILTRQPVRALSLLLGYRPPYRWLAGLLQRAWAQAEEHRWELPARALFRVLAYHRARPLLLSTRVVDRLAAVQAQAREARLRALGTTFEKLEQGREDLVSIGVFAYDRFDLLQRTCAALAAYLEKYGSNFRHEVIFFHDGPNEEIEAWARANPLFDKVIINEVNRGLSYNINRFWYEESKGKYILDLEDDWVCEYQDDFLSNALDIFRNDSRVGSVSFERRLPGDYQKWDVAAKIQYRVFSEEVYGSQNLHHRYHLLPKSSYGNSCSLYRFHSLALVGRLRDDMVRRRAQEGEFMRVYSKYWMGARGVAFKDSPFLHIGEGRSAPTWSQ